MKTLFILLLLAPFFAHALEVDEKLTLRIVRASESKKTIMINRGTEDGLVEGDHARFIVTAGIVARAVCIRVSPTRSVWSVYRLVNADFIQQDAVMTLKITPPVKITKDETQALVRDDTPSKMSTDPSNLGIPLADGAQDINPSEEGKDAADMAALEAESAVSLVDKNLEVFGIINISGLSATTKTSGGDGYSGSQSYQHIGIGGEYYSRREREWYSHFSLIASFSLMKQDSQSYNGSTARNDVNEFSAGINWHPTMVPNKSYTFIPYLHGAVNVGSVKSSYTPGTENPGGAEFASTGTSGGFTVGFGYKYFTHKGFGARAQIDYYLRNEKYKEDISTNAFTKSVVGPRLMMGLAYRF